MHIGVNLVESVQKHQHIAGVGSRMLERSSAFRYLIVRSDTLVFGVIVLGKEPARGVGILCITSGISSVIFYTLNHNAVIKREWEKAERRPHRRDVVGTVARFLDESCCDAKRNTHPTNNHRTYP